MTDITSDPPSTGQDTEREDLPGQLWHLWRQGHRPDVASFLARAGDVAPGQLVAVLLIDQRERWQAGETIVVEQYLRRFPLLEDNRDALLDLVYGEFLLREQQGDTPPLADYQRRFPQVADHLGQQLEFREALIGAAPDASQTQLDLSGPRPGSASWPEIAGYEILGALGHGGMGIVYQARQVSLNRLVALKMIRAQEAHAEDLTRFQIEAQAVARLQHPHIVQIYEIGAHAGRPYMALEYVAGGSLDKRLRGVPQPPRQAAKLVEILARATHAAHLRGIVHRDLKPANILLAQTNDEGPEAADEGKTKDGERGPGENPSGLTFPFAAPKITDFGLAKLLTGTDSNPTRTGEVMGTPSYMAPEQTDGRSIGPAADVYALGAILYELLTGRPPFKAATTVETVMQVRSDEPVPPSRLQPRTPRDLETICLKCLEKTPAKRYGSAADLAEDLRRFLGGEAIRARPARIWEKGWLWARRRPVRASLLGASAVFFAVGFPLVTWLWQEAVQTAEAEKRARTDLQSQVYFNSLTLAQAQLAAGNVSRAEELLNSVRPEMRQWEWHFLKRQRYGPPASFLWLSDQNKPHRINTAAFDPTGRLIVMANWDGDVRVIDAVSGVERLPIPAPRVKTVIAGVAYSPDGKHLAVAALFPAKVAVHDAVSGKRLVSLRGHATGVSRIAYRFDGRQLASASFDKTVNLWDARSGEVIHTLKGHDEAVYGLAYSPDGRLVASASFDASVKLWDADTGAVVRTLRGSKPGFKTGFLSAAFSPDGKILAAAGVEGVATGWNVATGEELFNARQDGGGILSLAFSADSKRLAGVGFSKTVLLWDTKTGQEVLTLRGHTDIVTTVAFSPDGRRLLTSSWDGTVKIWDARPLEANPWPQLHSLPDSDSVFGVVYCGKDGRRLASAGLDGVIRIWDPGSGKEIRTVKETHGAVHTLVASADGTRLASIGADAVLRLWDVSTGKETLHFPVPPGVTQAIFTPDGKRLATPSGDLIKMWDAATGKELESWMAHKGGCYGAAFTPDGRHLATVGFDEKVRVWEVATREQVFTLEGHTHVIPRVAYSQDGRRLASGGWDGIVKVWDQATGAELHTLRHGDAVWGLAFAPNGKRLVSAGMDGLIRIWNLETGKEEEVLRGHAGGVYFLSFSPDGKQLAACGGHRGRGEITIWDMAGVERKLESKAAASPVIGSGGKGPPE
jgi:WD40 repeat protein/serine/threonine protein kinase